MPLPDHGFHSWYTKTYHNFSIICGHTTTPKVGNNSRIVYNWGLTECLLCFPLLPSVICNSGSDILSTHNIFFPQFPENHSTGNIQKIANYRVIIQYSRKSVCSSKRYSQPKIYSNCGVVRPVTMPRIFILVLIFFVIV